jgi:hypothetical protein
MAHTVFVFRIILTTNGECFSKQHYPLNAERLIKTSRSDPFKN